MHYSHSSHYHQLVHCEVKGCMYFCVIIYTINSDIVSSYETGEYNKSIIHGQTLDWPRVKMISTEWGLR
jgi:hypothetical protein